MKKKARPTAAKRGRKTEKRPGRRVATALFLLVLLALGGLLGWMHVNSQLVHLEQAKLYLSDLPAQFEGATILFISDLNIKSEAEARQTARLMNKLEQLHPDMLILGGDYGADTLIETLNSDGDLPYAAAEDYLLDFIRGLSGFNAPMGRFAVLGDQDTDSGAIGAAFAQAGINLLTDACATVEHNGAQLVIAGLSDARANATPYSSLGGYFSGDECVVAVAHNPASYIGIRVNEARGGGAWADVVLSGHTLGGQIRVLGRNLRTLSDEESRCISGWYYADDLPMLVSQGLGCADIDLRLGSQSEVWLIELHRQQTAALPDF